MTSPTLPCPVPYCLCHPQQACHWTANPPTLRRPPITLFRHLTPHCSVPALSFPRWRCPAVSPLLPAASCAMLQEIAKNVQCQGTKIRKKRPQNSPYSPRTPSTHSSIFFYTQNISIPPCFAIRFPNASLQMGTSHDFAMLASSFAPVSSSPMSPWLTVGSQFHLGERDQCQVDHQ